MAKETGNLVKLTLTLATGTIVTTTGFKWTLRSRRRVWNTTPENTVTDEEYTYGTRTGTLDVWTTHTIGAATPPIPEGSVGTAVLYPDFINTAGKFYTAKVLSTGMDLEMQSNSGGQPNIWHYSFQCTLDSTNAIVPT